MYRDKRTALTTGHELVNVEDGIEDFDLGTEFVKFGVSGSVF